MVLDIYEENFLHKRRFQRLLKKQQEQNIL